MGRETAALLRLAGPLIANNLALAGMTFTDTVMAGRIGTRDLAAVGVGNALYHAAFLFGLGILMAMSPITAQAFGAGREREIGHYVRQSGWIALAIAVATMILMHNAGPLLALMGISEGFRPLAADYVAAVSYGAPAIFSYLVLRFASEGLGHTRPIAIVALLALVCNAIADWVLMYGKFGLPALGAVGCGYATALTQWLMLAFMLHYVVRGSPHVYSGLRIFARFERPHPRKIAEVLRLGVPIGVGVLAEVGLFSAAALLVGRLGSAAAGAHQVAINYAATMFMVPLGIHSATMARVGQKAGRGDLAGARFTGFTGIGACTLFMTASALVMLSFRGPIISLYTNDPAVWTIANGLLLMAAIFQISDGVQAGAMGALRGLKDTTVPMALSILAYWGVGFAFAWYTVVVLGRGPTWVWAALAAGLTVAAVLLTGRFAWIMRRA